MAICEDCSKRQMVSNEGTNENISFMLMQSAAANGIDRNVCEEEGLKAKGLIRGHRVSRRGAE